MTPRYRHPTIQERGGLKAHLDATKDKHNGLGYDDFARYLSPDNGFRKADIIKAFGITYPTLYHWLDVWHQELDNEQS